MVPKKIRIRGLPNPIKVYADAALTSLKGNKTPHHAFAGIILECEEVHVDGPTVRDYARVCGFRPSSTAPISFPFTLTFPLQVSTLYIPSISVSIYYLNGYCRQ